MENRNVANVMLSEWFSPVPLVISFQYLLRSNGNFKFERLVQWFFGRNIAFQYEKIYKDVWLHAFKQSHCYSFWMKLFKNLKIIRKQSLFIFINQHMKHIPIPLWNKSLNLSKYIKRASARIKYVVPNRWFSSKLSKFEKFLGSWLKGVSFTFEYKFYLTS